MNELKADEKDSLTESDIKTIEDKIINKFISEFTEFSNEFTKATPKSAEELRQLSWKLQTLSGSLSSAIHTLDNLNYIKLD